jgi:hypothetical protein
VVILQPHFFISLLIFPGPHPGGLGRRSLINFKIFSNKTLHMATSTNWNLI